MPKINIIYQYQLEQISLFLGLPVSVIEEEVSVLVNKKETMSVKIGMGNFQKISIGICILHTSIG